MIDFELKIPRSEIEEIEAIITDELSKFDEKYHITICGSYRYYSLGLDFQDLFLIYFRRGKKESGDIDVLLTHSDFTTKTKDKTLKSKYLKDVVEVLKTNGLITETISLGETKFMVYIFTFYRLNTTLQLFF